MQHKLGECPVGDVSIAIAISSEHRKDSLAAVEFAINELKRTVPIWKKVQTEPVFIEHYKACIFFRICLESWECEYQCVFNEHVSNRSSTLKASLYGKPTSRCESHSISSNVSD